MLYYFLRRKFGYYYLYHFFPIVFFGFLNFNEIDIKNIYKILHWLALFFCFFAIIQEVIYSPGFPIGDEVRFGIFRTPSLMGNSNLFGLYAVLFFMLDFSLYRKIRWQNIVFLVGIFLSVSRMAWLSLILCFLFLIMQNKKRSVKVLIFTICFILIIVLIMLFGTHTLDEWSNEGYYRGYVMSKSLEIWRDSPILGVGPGMYGGVISVIFNSSIYNKYQFSQHWYDYGLKGFHSLDNFWFQCLGELGIIGIIIFIILLVALYQVARVESNKSKNGFRKKILQGFSTIPILLFVYLFGSGLNFTPILLTYSILLGLVLGIRNESIIDK